MELTSRDYSDLRHMAFSITNLRRGSSVKLSDGKCWIPISVTMTKIPSIVNATGKAAPLKINERYHRVEGAGVERGGLTDTNGLVALNKNSFPHKLSTHFDHVDLGQAPV